MRTMSFSDWLPLVPLAYVIHHYEERVILSLSAWRQSWLNFGHVENPDTNFFILLAVGLFFILMHNKLNNRYSIGGLVIYISATQAHNVIFHIGSSLWIGHLVPGTATALLITLPANVLLAFKAWEEKLISVRTFLTLFVISGFLYWGYELRGIVVALAAAAFLAIALWADKIRGLRYLWRT